MTTSTTLQFPTARIETVTKTIGGITFKDPYAWLVEDSHEALDWQWAQDAAAQQYLAGLPEVEQLLEPARRVSQDLLGSVMGHQLRRLGGRWFSMGSSPDGASAIRVSDSLDGEARVLIDTGQLARELNAKGAVQIIWFQPAPDGKHVVFSVSVAGEMFGTWRVVEVDSGNLLPLSIPAPLFTGAQPGWAADGKGFYLFDRADDNRHRVRYFDLHDGVRADSERVFDTSWISEVVSGVLPQVSPGGRRLIGMSMPHEHVALVIGDLESREGQLHPKGTRPQGDNYPHKVDGPASQGEWRPFLPDGFHGECKGDWLDDDTYLAIVTDETPRGELVAIPAQTSRDRSTWRTLVPESDAVLRAALVLGDRIVLCDMADVSVRFRLLKLDGTPDGEIPVEPYGSSPIAYVIRRFDRTEELVFSHATFARAGTEYHFDGTTRELRVLGEPGERIEGLTVSQRFATSKDGARVPYFVIHRDNLDVSSPQPALINAYGGFNVALLPTFLGSVEPFLRAGGVYVVANLRGGAEYGREWYDAGRLHSKQNTFDDLFAVAQDAIDSGLTSSEQLAFKGDSNGGLLAGVAAIQRPDLWRVVVAGVPLFDMMEPLPGDDPTTAAVRAIFFEDYGDPTKPEDAPITYAYSPYHNVRDSVAYPALLQVFGEKDLGCMPFHGRKLTARLQPATTSDAPILLRVWRDTGHGSVDPEIAARQLTEWLGFVMHHLGMSVSNG